MGEIGPVKLDGLPFAFKRDLLAHEAHRHPYLELFGLICLLKLRCGDEFGRRGNASWRLLATLTLMPWLKKYRLGVDTELLREETEASHYGQDGLALADPSSTQLTESMEKLKNQAKQLKKRVLELTEENERLRVASLN